MTGKLVIFILGFDEKLVLRAGFRVGLQPGDRALIIYSVGGGEFEKGKVMKALENVRNIFASAGVQVTELAVNAMNFGEDVAEIIKTLRSLNPEKIVLALGSGMRYLGFTALFATLLYREHCRRRIKIYVHVAREDGLYDIVVSIDFIKLIIGPSELNFICYVRDGKPRDTLVKSLAKLLNKSISTMYSLLNRLEEKGFVVTEEGVVKPTSLGEAIIYTICGESRG